MLRIYAAQLNLTVGAMVDGDISGNAEKILAAYQTGVDKGADVVVVPELAICGYPPEDLLLQPHFITACRLQAEKIAAQTTATTALIFGCPWATENAHKPYNAALIAQGGKIIATVGKQILPNDGVFDEHRYFTPAPPAAPVDIKGVPVGILVCEDIWHPTPAAQLKNQGACVFICINASPYHVGKFEQRVHAAGARVRENHLPCLYLNTIGGQDELVFDGQSFALNPTAPNIVLHRQRVFEETACMLRLALTTKGWCFEEDSGVFALNPPEEIYRALMLSLHDYMHKTGFTNSVLGLSGGIDSALVACIARDTLGAEQVQTLLMPSSYTSAESKRDAQMLAQNLNIKLLEIPISEPIATLTAHLKPHMPVSGITAENMQARLRAIMLMAYSNANPGTLLLSTGNKSELAMGYATLYGDMCGGFNPLKDVYKTQVYALAQWRNSRGAAAAFAEKYAPPIPDYILTRAPSAELKPNQTDQDTLPPYDVLDAILQHAIEGYLSADDIIRKGFAPGVVARVLHLLKVSEHKRKQAVMGTKITPRAFGKDWRLPVATKKPPL